MSGETSTQISAVRAWQAFDSRGRPTVACRVELSGGASGRCVVPSGASTGTFEAFERRDGRTHYAGDGVLDAVDSVNSVIADRLVGEDASHQDHLDGLLESLDGTSSLENLGANAVLSVSVAIVIAAANAAGIPLYRALLDGARPILPMPMVNVISGGAHAGGVIDIQDILVVPVGAGSFAEAISWAWEVRAAAATIFTERGKSASLVADEGGLAGEMRGNEEALEIVALAIERAGLVPGRDAAIAVDLAANQLASPGGNLRLRSEQRTVSADEWLAEVEGWVARYPIISVEDVAPDQDWDTWADASRRLGSGIQLLGDDLFVTSTALLQRGIDNGIANAVLVKPNQAGTISRARAAVSLAAAAGYRTVVSARSGDTEDDWLADLAVGWRAGQIKVGSTMRSERTAKWNRLLEIEDQLGDESDFSRPFPVTGAAA